MKWYLISVSVREIYPRMQSKAKLVVHTIELMRLVVIHSDAFCLQLLHIVLNCRSEK